MQRPAGHQPEDLRGACRCRYYGLKYSSPSREAPPQGRAKKPLTSRATACNGRCRPSCKPARAPVAHPRCLKSGYLRASCEACRGQEAAKANPATTSFPSGIRSFELVVEQLGRPPPVADGYRRLYPNCHVIGVPTRSGLSGVLGASPGSRSLRCTSCPHRSSPRSEHLYLSLESPRLGY